MRKRVDNNQKKLVEQIRRIPGTSVAHTHMIGEGFPDLVCGFRGRTFLLEVKDPAQPPSKRRLTEDEKKFHEEWTGQIDVVETIDDVLRILELK